MSRIPSTRVKKIPNCDSTILTHVHIPLKITLGYGNQVFHILQYICQLFYLPLQNFTVRHPQSLHNYPILMTLNSTQVSHWRPYVSWDYINHLIHHFVHRWSPLKQHLHQNYQNPTFALAFSVLSDFNSAKIKHSIILTPTPISIQYDKTTNFQIPITTSTKK